MERDMRQSMIERSQSCTNFATSSLSSSPLPAKPCSNPSNHTANALNLRHAIELRKHQLEQLKQQQLRKQQQLERQKKQQQQQDQQEKEQQKLAGSTTNAHNSTNNSSSSSSASTDNKTQSADEKVATSEPVHSPMVKLKPHNGFVKQKESQEELHALMTSAIAAAISASSDTCLPIFPPMRRKKLHRQPSSSSTSSSCSSFSSCFTGNRERRHNQAYQDELAYQADLEEEETEAETEQKPHKHTPMLGRANTSTACTMTDTIQHGTAGNLAGNNNTMPRRHRYSQLVRDNSAHSDSSRYSSVDSLLEARKPDPEAILLNLGFGPVGSEDILARIPKRFLQPSKVRGNDTEAFVKRLQLATNIADHSSLGYRGLTGNPDAPPSTIVAKIMQRFEVYERKKSMGSI